MVRMVTEERREIPVAYESDVVVLGGGPAGVAAALAAARSGARTLLVERYDYLGGMATGGLVIWLPKFEIVKGVPGEVVERLAGMGATSEEALPQNVTIDPEGMKFLLFEMLEEAGVELLLDTYAVDAIVHEGRVEGVIVENKGGRQAILAEVTVDATGDGDIAAASGAPFEKGRAGDGLTLPVTLIFFMDHVDEEEACRYLKEDPGLKRLLREAREKGELQLYSEEDLRLLEGKFTELERFYFTYSIGYTRTAHKGEVGVEGAKVFGVDGVDTHSLTRAHLLARRRVRLIADFLRRRVPGFKGARISLTAPQMGVRETRRIMGGYVLTEEDVSQKRRFEDAVIREPVQIPYRCLLPREIDGLLVAGRCISTTHEALNMIRDIPMCMGMGQAAGAAAALCVKKGVKPRELEFQALQATLEERGML